MKKKRGDIVGILIMALLVIVLGFLFLKFLQRPIPETAEQRVDQLLHPALYLANPPPASLQNFSSYQADFIPAEKLKEYMLAFTNDHNFTDTYWPLIQFQQGLNGVGLSSALAIDLALAESLTTAAEKVKVAGKKDKEACSYFNSLLNPSLLVLDLTLWTGKSDIYTTLQQYREIGIQCEFYFPALQHGMFTYNPRTAKIVQKTLFCDPTERKVKCFGVWNYFWKFAAEPQEGVVNYGVGCTMTDWMLQGFVCVNGIDLRRGRDGTILWVEDFRPHQYESVGLVDHSVKDSFYSVLGASGKSIIDNVKRKCSQIRDKASLYGDLAGMINDLSDEEGISSSITGGISGVKTITKTELRRNEAAEDLQQQYENSMLLASLFAEACMQEPSNFGKSQGGDLGSIGGINAPLSCTISEFADTDAARLRKTVECISNLVEQSKMPTLLSENRLEGIPDPNCKISAVGDGKCSSIKCITKSGDGEGSRNPTSQEDKAIRKYGGKGQYKIFDDEQKFKDTCGGNAGGGCSDVDKSDKAQHGPTYLHKDYINANTIKHEEWHKACPTCTETQVDELTKKGDNPPKKTVTPEEAKKSCPDCTTLPDDKKKEGYPGPEGEDKCSANAQRMEEITSCMELPRKSDIIDESRYEGKKPTPDPAPDDVGQDFTSCAEAASTDGMFNNPAVGARDDCMFGDQNCDFPGAYYGGMIQGKINKKCQYVEDDAGLQCPPKS